MGGWKRRKRRKRRGKLLLDHETGLVHCGGQRTILTRAVLSGLSPLFRGWRGPYGRQVSTLDPNTIEENERMVYLVGRVVVLLIRVRLACEVDHLLQGHHRRFSILLLATQESKK